jgi:hypothetical protein
MMALMRRPAGPAEETLPDYCVRLNTFHLLKERNRANAMFAPNFAPQP